MTAIENSTDPRQIGPQDTYVRSFRRGAGSRVDWAHHLSQYSALADILGLIEKRR